MEFFIDPSRCIGCQACVHACAECDSHRGQSMIHLDYIDRALSPQTTPVVCMHCEEPACANVCPADAIKQTPDRIVQSALADRCIGCGNCVLACPFGVPKYVAAMDQMMKCDLCYDRTSAGLKPMCATVCPSGALWCGPRGEIEKHRRERPLNLFVFGRQVIKTKVHLMGVSPTAELEIDVMGFMETPCVSSPLGADKGRYHDPEDGKAELHPLSNSPPSKGERKGVPSPSMGEG